MFTSTESEQWEGHYYDVVRDVQQYRLIQEAQAARAKTRRFRRVLLTISMVFALFTTIVAVTFLAKIEVLRPEPLNDPLLAYADVFPGQSLSISRAHEFSCYPRSNPRPVDVFAECVLRPQSGLFSQVNVLIWNGLIIRLVFRVHEHTVTVGDLLLWWGNAEFTWVGENGIFRWPERRLRVRGYFPTGRLTYFSPVSQVSFTS